MPPAPSYLCFDAIAAGAAVVVACPPTVTQFDQGQRLFCPVESLSRSPTPVPVVASASDRKRKIHVWILN